jgi:hypothetical protein
MYNQTNYPTPTYACGRSSGMQLGGIADSWPVTLHSAALE